MINESVLSGILCYSSLTFCNRISLPVPLRAPLRVNILIHSYVLWQHRSPWCDVAVRASTPLAPTLFYCLLNTGLSYDPIGWGIPYGSTFVSDNDEPLADICLQVP